MTTHIELRLPRVKISEVTADSAALDGAALQGAATVTRELGSHRRPTLPFGLRSSSVEAGVRLCADVLALVTALAVVRPEVAPAALWAAVVLGSFAALGLYSHRLRLSALDDLHLVLVSSAVGLAATYVALDHLRQGLRVTLLGGALLILGRIVSYALLRAWRSRGVLRRDAVLVGGGSRAADLVARISQHPELGLRVRGVLGAQGPRLPGPAIAGDVMGLPDLVAAGFVDTVIVVDASSDEERRVIDALRNCVDCTLDIFVLPRLAELTTLSDDQVWGIPLQKLKQRRSPAQVVAKRILDVTLASAALLVVSPLLGLAALAVRLELGPGVIYRQERVGLNGRSFELLKLRSMRPQPEGSTSQWAPDAARTSRVGAFLRRYSVDELPQLVNVIRGDMSLVGPRPERPEYVDKFGHEVPSYVYRHRAMVGLTGLAAVEGLRGDTSIADRAYFDNWYIEHWSLWLDVKIMVRTASALLRGTGG
jgi:exopolysaccharide biosynthesis polyprenyl glycosylphosphotransferase